MRPEASHCRRWTNRTLFVVAFALGLLLAATSTEAVLIGSQRNQGASADTDSFSSEGTERVSDFGNDIGFGSHSFMAEAEADDGSTVSSQFTASVNLAGSGGSLSGSATGNVNTTGESLNDEASAEAGLSFNFEVTDDPVIFNFSISQSGDATAFYNLGGPNGTSGGAPGGFTRTLDPGMYDFSVSGQVGLSGGLTANGQWNFSGSFSPAVSEPDFHWTNPAGGSFSDGANWAGGTAPTGSADEPIFDLPDTYAVNLSGPAQSGNMRVSRGDVTINLNNNSLVVDNTLIVGDTAGQSATLRLPQIDGLAVDNIVVGTVDGADGQLMLGPNGVLPNSLTAGDIATSATPANGQDVTVRQGSQLMLTGGTAMFGNVSLESMDPSTPAPLPYPSLLKVDGTNDPTVKLEAEMLSLGRLPMTDGDEAGTLKGLVSINTGRVKAQSVMLNADALIDQGSKLEAGQLVLADEPGAQLVSLEVTSNSTLDIEPGGSTTIGENSKATIRTRGFSRVNADGTPITVGKSAMGMLEVSDQSDVSAGDITIGQDASAMGMVSVESEQGMSTVAADNIDVAIEGTGELNVMDGGQVTATDAIQVSGPATPTEPEGAGLLSISGTPVQFGPGTLRVEGTGQVLANTIDVGENGELVGTGTVETANGLTFAGKVRPGSSPGQLTTIGPVHQVTQGILEIEINGRTPITEYDVWNIMGDTVLEGKLLLLFGFAPELGDTFQFLQIDPTSSLDVDFDQIMVMGLRPGYEFELVVDTTGASLRTTAAPSNAAAIPEPVSLTMVFLGLCATARRGRRAR